jgi:ligand-binding SRPBCC domain-containing protein
VITKIYSSLMPCPPERLWQFHQSVEALKILAPPGAKAEILGPDTAVENGALHRLRIIRWGLPLRWDARISEVEPGRQFRDTAERSPFAAWTHLHEFLPHPAGSELRDTVSLEPPFGPLGGLAWRAFLSRDIDAMFGHRHEMTRRAMEGLRVLD